MPATSPLVFVPLCLGKGVTHNRRKLSCLYRLAVVDTDIPKKYWTALRRSEPFVQLGAPTHRRMFLYESILGPVPDGKMILYRNGDPLDLRRSNLEYIAPSPHVVLTLAPNSVVSTLDGYDEAIRSTYHDLENLQKVWSGRRWAAVTRNPKLSCSDVAALLEYYVARYTEQELEHSAKHERRGESMEGCQEFLMFERKIEDVPSTRQIRRILKGDALYSPELADHYRKAKMLLPCVRGLLTPEPKNLFRPIQPTK